MADIKSAVVNGVPAMFEDEYARGKITEILADFSNYYKKTETYSKTEIDEKISIIPTMDIKAVDTLPTENISTRTIYLVPNGSTTSQNVKTEYINTDGTSDGWEIIGSTEIDLSGYLQLSGGRMTGDLYLYNGLNITNGEKDYTSVIGEDSITLNACTKYSSTKLPDGSVRYRGTSSTSFGDGFLKTDNTNFVGFSTNLFKAVAGFFETLNANYGYFKDAFIKNFGSELLTFEDGYGNSLKIFGDVKSTNSNDEEVSLNGLASDVDSIQEDITELNKNLTDYGLDNKFDGNALQGYYNTTSGQFVSDKHNVCCASKIACDGGQSIRVIFNKSLYFRAIFYNESGSVVGNYISSGADTEFNIVANANAKSFTFYSSSNGSLIPNVSEAKTYRVYVDNAIDEIKNDLTVSSGTITYKNCSVSDSSITYCKKSGRFVQCSLSLKEATTTSNWQEILKLPYKPISAMNILDMANMKVFTLGGLGEIAIGEIISNKSLVFNFTYLTND